MAVELEGGDDGVWVAPNARIIDKPGRKRLPIGYGDFISAVHVGSVIDKTMLVADVLDSGYAATLFCRPRRFGKTLNITMLKAYLEAPEAGGLSREDAEEVFRGTEVWDASDGRYRQYQGAFPVVHMSFSTVKKLTWAESLAEIRRVVSAEFLSHAYLRGEHSPLPPEDIKYFDCIAGGIASDADYAGSLAALCRMLYVYHGRGTVILIDEYDAPVMSGYTNGYYDEVVSFLKGWLTGALKDGGLSVAFSCLTGVQRISKESIFSDLNNLYVSTPLGDDFDERFGFTEAEVLALASYLGRPDCASEAKAWYDGYRFGTVDVYNPWSVANYLNKGCSPGIYWGNTSGNSVLGSLVAEADSQTLGDIYSLLESHGVVWEPLDLGVVFPDLGVRQGALWSMLYLAGYLTTDETEDPSDRLLERALRIPNREVAQLYRYEVVDRFMAVAGGRERLRALHRALVTGDDEAFGSELNRIALQASAFDLTEELACHMLLMGLLFGVPGYHDPLSDRESGRGRYDIRLEPDPAAKGRRISPSCPLVTVEVKFTKRGASDERLGELVAQAIAQIAERGYDAKLPPGADGRLRWGVAFSGKRVAASCERA